MRRFLLASALIAIGCTGRGTIDTNAPIIIISIDTLRSDHLPAYGYTKVATPAIDRLRNDAILFEHAYAPCPLTLVSHASIFTGLLPAEHGIRDNLGYYLNPKAATLPELLKSKGYATGGAVSAMILRGDTGINRGFDFWEDSIDRDPSAHSAGRAQRSGDETRAIAETWIGRHRSQPFFFFFHIYEPHTPYTPAAPFRSRYGATYDGEVATSDAIVGRFLDYLRREGIYDRATILLISDHGEGLGDHGEDEHGILLYRETLQVPLILKLPQAARKGTSVPTPVQLIDVFPTIANAFGEKKMSEGRSLLDVADDKVPGDRAIYSETYYPRLHYGWSDLHSLISGANHYIHSNDPEMYDLASDPAERKNVLAENRRAYGALRDQVKRYIKDPTAPSEVSDETKRQLIALGYLGSTINTAANAVLPDPKKNIGKANAIGQAFRLLSDAKYEETVDATRALLRDNPNMLDLWALQSRALAKLKRPEEAIEAAKQGLRVAPGSATLAMMVANLSLDLGRLDDAEAYATLAMKQIPRQAHEVLARAALQRKNYAKARDEANAVFASDRNQPDGLVLLAHIAIEEGKLDDALRSLDQALALLQSSHRRPLPQLNFLRGDTLVRLGRADEAEQAFLAEIRDFPAGPQAYTSLIFLYAKNGENPANLGYSLEKAAPTAPSYVAIAEALKAIGDERGSRFWAQRGLDRYPNHPRLKVLVRG